MSLRQKLLAGFALVAAITAAIGTTGYLALQRTSRNVDELGLNRLPSLRSLLELSVAQNIVDSAENALLSRAISKEERAAAWARFDLGQRQAGQAFKVYEPLPQTPEEAALWARFAPAWKTWWTDHLRYVELARAFERTGTEEDYARLSSQALTTNYQSFGPAEDLLQQLVRLNEGLAAQATQEALATGEAARRFMAVALAVATLAAMLVGLWLARDINRALSRVISSLQAGAEQVANASGQVSASSQQLANSATQQAASLQEISSSLEEIGSMTRQNVASARAANDSAREASAAAAQGETAVQSLGEAVGRIRESAGQTAKIVKTIDEIAFQTNLLALNAAVEAARAGDAGRGFAVVAEEVRTLALRAAEAARSTGELLEVSGHHAEGGVAASSAVAEALQRILGSVGTVSGHADQVATASGQQARGLDQITTAVSQLDTLTQGTAASAEESAAASEELSGQAVEVEQAVGSLVALVSGQVRPRPPGRPEAATATPMPTPVPGPCPGRCWTSDRAPTSSR